MLLQTNSYIVPKEKRAEHSRLIRRFRQTLLRLGCDHFEVYEQVGSNWSNSESAGRYVQILRFLDRKHQLAVQSAERTDPTAQAVIADFCELINFPYQQQQGLFAVGFYTSVLPVAPKRGSRGELVSTVEHEVVNDPEAEMPYPGSSDGPPVEEPATDAVSEEIPADAMVEQPISERIEEFEDELEHEPLVEHVDDPGDKIRHDLLEAEAVPVALAPEEVVAEVVPAGETHVHAPVTSTKSSDEFIDLMSGELAEDDTANGFMEVDFSDELEGEPHLNGEPTHPHPAEHHEST